MINEVFKQKGPFEFVVAIICASGEPGFLFCKDKENLTQLLAEMKKEGARHKAYEIYKSVGEEIPA